MRRPKRDRKPGLALITLFSAVLGGAVAAAAALALGLLELFLLRDVLFSPYIAALALVAGGVFAGWVSGKLRRRKGLKCGALAGAAFYALLAAVGLALGGGLPGLHKLVILAGLGAVGGVAGVNSKAYK